MSTTIRQRVFSDKPNGSQVRPPPRHAELSSDTLRDLDRQLRNYKHREHLNENNYYENSRASSPASTGTESSSPPESIVSVDDKLSIKRGRLQRKKTVGFETPTRRHMFVNLSHKHQLSILEQESSRSSTFFGFYSLFWITTAVMICRTGIQNYITTGIVLDTHIASILHRDLIKVGLTDLWMYLCTYFSVLLQLGCKHGYIRWETTGWILQNVFQTAFLFFFLWFSDYMKFPWIGSVFLLLHSLVLLMKMHSYAFYNGYFWGMRRDLHHALQLLAKVEANGRAEPDQVTGLEEQVDFLIEEIDMQSTTTPFPTNITWKNYFMYTMFPTVVYQIEYPRTQKIRWDYVFIKAAAVFGVMFLMIVVAEQYLYPFAMQAKSLQGRPLFERMQLYPFILLNLVPPFILMYLLVFYIIWETILNAIAELTRFADREFYGEWWNCVTWDQFAKDWNTPVHRFLLRHVYHSSMSALHVSKPVATLLTFLLSSAVHELVMYSIFRKLRGYLLILQMCQLPLVAISRTKYLRNRKLLGNVIFWIGIITGPSLMCSLYLTF